MVRGMLGAAFALLAVHAAATEVYRHVDKDGVVHYSDQPPTKGAKPIALPPIQIVGPVGKDSKGDVGALAGPVIAIQVLSPGAETTFRTDDRRVPVSVSLNPPLPEGYGLLYLLDGNPQNLKATRALSYALESVERGEHLISVAAVDAAGREVARSAPVIVHMKPPAVAGKN